MTERPTAEDLSTDRVQGMLRTERIGRSMDVHGETASTMDDARVAADEGAPEGHVVVADRQTAGRGAHGRRWESPPGVDLYFSIVSRTDLPAGSRPLLTLAVGLGVAEAAEALCGVPARIKWPNDVWLQGKKCAGVLVETTTRGSRAQAAILGVGLNVNRRRWPAELEPIATSLAQARGGDGGLDRAEALARALEGIERCIDRLVEQGPAPVVDALARRLALRGEEVRVDGTRGVLEGVNDAGAALVRTAEGTSAIIAGTLRRAE